MLQDHIIMTESYYNFQKELENVLAFYPNFRIKENNGLKYLKGVLDIRNSEKIYVRSFAIEIHHREGYPFRFPTVIESGGEIPVSSDWHKYDDGSCCLTIPPQEIIECSKGITLLEFLNDHVIPYFANQSHKLLFGKYKNEYSHGKDGFKEFYEDLMKTSEVTKWHENYNFAFGKKPLHSRGKYDKCFCGNGKRYDKCHLKIFEKLRLIGESQVEKHFKYILN